MKKKQNRLQKRIRMKKRKRILSVTILIFLLVVSVIVYAVFKLREDDIKAVSNVVTASTKLHDPPESIQISDSQILSKDIISSEETSSEKIDLSSKVTISAAGDYMLHVGPMNAGKKEDGTYDYSPFMNDIKPYVNGDLNFTDIEGPVNAYGDNSNLSSDYWAFNYPQELLDAIKYAGFNTIVTANNHAYDGGWDGLVQMRKNISNAGLDFLGTYTNEQEYNEYYIKDINGIKVGVVAWTALDNGLGETMGEHISYSMRKFDQYTMNDVPKMLEDVKKMREQGAEAIIMPLHWGEEYQDEPSGMQREIAKALVEGGVDILIGDHPHCVQPIEVYKVNRNGREQNAMCIYSLGNFFADQIGLYPPEPKTQYGMLIKADIVRNSDGAINIENMSYMPTVCFADEKKAHYGHDFGYSLIPAGKYAKMETQPEDISNEVWVQAKDAWNHVCNIAGNQITVYDGN